MVANRNRRLHGLRERLRQLVAGSRRGKERLPLAVDEVYPDPHNLLRDWYHDPRYADDVLRLLHQNAETTYGGSRPSSTESVGSVVDERSWLVPNPSDAREITARVSFDLAQHSDCE